MGLTQEEEVAAFYMQTVHPGSFPITGFIPNEETQEVIKKANAGGDLISIGGVDGLMAKIQDARPRPDDEV